MLVAVIVMVAEVLAEEVEAGETLVEAVYEGVTLTVAVGVLVGVQS